MRRLSSGRPANSGGMSSRITKPCRRSSTMNTAPMMLSSSHSKQALRRQRIAAVQHRQHAVLAAHVVRPRRDRPQRRPAQDEFVRSPKRSRYVRLALPPPNCRTESGPSAPGRCARRYGSSRLVSSRSSGRSSISSAASSCCITPALRTRCRSSHDSSTLLPERERGRSPARSLPQLDPRTRACGPRPGRRRCA